jgi:hypothetical protein
MIILSFEMQINREEKDLKEREKVETIYISIFLIYAFSIELKTLRKYIYCVKIAI